MDIAGFWTGEYSYDAAGFPEVEFQAELNLAGAILSGVTTEKNTFDQGSGEILIAELFGKVSGHNVHFTKSYTNTQASTDKVIYKGSISNDGNLITGRWSIARFFSGSYRMARAIEQKSKAQIVTANEVEIA